MGEREKEGEGARGHRTPEPRRSRLTAQGLASFRACERRQRLPAHRAQRNRCGGGRNPATSAVKARTAPEEQAFRRTGLSTIKPRTQSERSVVVVHVVLVVFVAVA